MSKNSLNFGLIFGAKNGFSFRQARADWEARGPFLLPGCDAGLRCSPKPEAWAGEWSPCFYLCGRPISTYVVFH